MSKYLSLFSRASQLKGKTAHAATRLVAGAEVATGAFAVSYLVAKTGKRQLGVGKIQAPTELLTAGVLYGAAIAGLAGKHADDLMNFGNGAIAAYLAGQGARMGAQKSGAKVSGTYELGAGGDENSGEVLLRAARLVR